MEDRRIKAIGSMLMASFLFASMTASIRLGCSRLPAMETVFVRGFLDAILLYAVLKRRRISFRNSNIRSLFLRGTYGFFGVSCVFSSILLIPVADATALFKSSALFMPFIARFMLKEQLKVARITLALIGFIGASFILKPSWDSVSLGGLIALIGSFFNGLAYASIRKLSPQEHPLMIMFSFLALSAIYSGLFFGYTFISPNGNEWLFLFIVAILGYFGQYAVTLAFRFAPAGVIAPWNYFEIAFSLILGWIFLNQNPDIFSLLGMLLLVSSAIAITKT